MLCLIEFASRVLLERVAVDRASVKLSEASVLVRDWQCSPIKEMRE